MQGINQPRPRKIRSERCPQKHRRTSPNIGKLVVTRRCDFRSDLRKSLIIRMAERGGFEPPVQCNPYNGLANRCFQPLSHLSKPHKFNHLQQFHGFFEIGT